MSLILKASFGAALTKLSTARSLSHPETPPLGLVRCGSGEDFYCQFLKGVKLPDGQYMLALTSNSKSGISNTLVFPEETFTRAEAETAIERLDRVWKQTRSAREFSL